MTKPDPVLEGYRCPRCGSHVRQAKTDWKTEAYCSGPRNCGVFPVKELDQA
jgi:hypothetical protein